MLISEKQYILLPLFKSFLFKKVHFETKSKDKQDEIIVKALNIKNRKERITYLYDATCDYIDNYYEGKNICGFKNGYCYSNRVNGCKYKYGCCRICIYKSSKGCPSKNLACKLFNCSEVYKRRTVISYKDLKTLKLFSLRQRYIVKIDYFNLREDVLRDLYSYSMIYSTIRVVYRLIKNNIIRIYNK